MRDGFEEYFDLSENDFKNLWGSAVFVFDTNALLSLFRDKKSTSDDLMNLIKSLKDRVWVPHQVAMEFHKNRAGVVIGNKKLYQPLKNAIESAKKQAEEAIRKNMDGYKHHPVMSVSEAISYINDKFDSIISDIKKMEEDSPRDDHYKNVLDALVDSLSHCTGSEYSSEDIIKIISDGKASCEANMPPGYIDYQKKHDRPIEERLGDYILWRQMIDYAVAKNCPIIFVTDDVKEDWWREVKGEKVGPRLELVREFMNKASNRFHAYTRSRFLEMAKEYLNADIKKETIDDVRVTSLHPNRIYIGDLNSNSESDNAILEKLNYIRHMGRKKGEWKVVGRNVKWPIHSDKNYIISLKNERERLMVRHIRASDYHRLSLITKDENSARMALMEKMELEAQMERITVKIDMLTKQLEIHFPDDDSNGGNEINTDFME